MLTRFSFMYIVITSAPCVSSDPNFQRRQLATGNWLIAKFVNCYLGAYWEQNELANRNTQAIPISASDSIVLIAIKSWKRLKKKIQKKANFDGLSITPADAGESSDIARRQPRQYSTQNFIGENTEVAESLRPAIFNHSKRRSRLQVTIVITQNGIHLKQRRFAIKHWIQILEHALYLCYISPLVPFPPFTFSRVGEFRVAVLFLDAATARGPKSQYSTGKRITSKNVSQIYN